MANKLCIVLSQWQIKMENQTQFRLPKLRPNESNPQATAKTKAQSSYTHLIPQETSMNSKQKIDPAHPSGTIKDSRSKSSAFGLSNISMHPHLKSKYVSKSPQYFKRRERSMHNLETVPAPDSIPVEKYIEGQMRVFDKEALITLARQGLYQKTNPQKKMHPHRVIPRKKKVSGEEKNQHQYSQYSNFQQASFSHNRSYTNTNKATLQANYQIASKEEIGSAKGGEKKQILTKKEADIDNDTKYGKFRPPSIAPVRHAFLKVQPAIQLSNPIRSLQK